MRFSLTILFGSTSQLQHVDGRRTINGFPKLVITSSRAWTGGEVASPVWRWYFNVDSSSVTAFRRKRLLTQHCLYGLQKHSQRPTMWMSFGEAAREQSFSADRPFGARFPVGPFDNGGGNCSTFTEYI